MAFSVKDWKNAPDATTPISAEALEDMEERLSTYTDDEVIGASFNRPSIVTLGDSITAQNVNLAASGSFDSSGFWNWTAAFLHQRFEWLNNAGGSGERTDQYLTRLATDVLVYSPQWCVVQGGGNDVTQGYTSAQIIDSLTDIYDALRAAGIKVVACTILSTTAANTGGEQTALTDTNEWIREYAGADPGFLLCDWYDVMTDSGPSDPVDGVTSDGTHPTNLGAYYMGRVLYETLENRVEVSSILPTSDTDPSQIFTNPLMDGDTGGLATGVTHHWDGSTGTATKAKVVRDDDYGEWQSINVDSGTTNNSWYIQQSSTSNFAEGDQVYGVCELDINSGGTLNAVAGSCPMGLEMFVRDYSSVTSVIVDGLRSQGSYTAMEEYPSGRIVLRTPTVTVPASIDEIYIRARSTIEDANVRFGRMQVFRVEP